MLYICNVDEISMLKGNKFSNVVKEKATSENNNIVIVSAAIESQIAEFENEEEKLRRKKFLWNIIKTPIFKALNYKEAKEITDIIFSKNGFDAFSYLVEILDTSMRVEHLDFVPDKGAVLLAGNHPTGLIDGIVMFQVLKVKRPDYALYANSDLIKLAPRFTDVIIPVEWIESERTSEKSRKTLKREIERIIKSFL